MSIDGLSWKILSIFVPYWSTLGSNLLYCYFEDCGASICFVDRMGSGIDSALLSIFTILSNIF